MAWTEFLIAFFIVKGIKKKNVPFIADLREHLSREKNRTFLMPARAVIKRMQ